MLSILSAIGNIVNLFAPAVDIIPNLSFFIAFAPAASAMRAFRLFNELIYQKEPLALNVELFFSRVGAARGLISGRKDGIGARRVVQNGFFQDNVQS
jgi:hypothetical protein